MMRLFYKKRRDVKNVFIIGFDEVITFLLFMGQDEKL
jgi:hypothetical protein